MKLLIPKGATSKSVDIFIRDSSVTTGAGLTGLVYNTSSLTAYYHRPGSAATSITLATLASATAAYSSGGFIAVDGTNMPGLYRVDLPNAVLASGVNEAVVMLRGAANMEPVTLEIQLTDVNLNDAVRAGLTALPNVASGSAGAIITSGTGTAQIASTSGNVALTTAGNTAVATELMGTTVENNGTITFKGLLRLLGSAIYGRSAVSGSSVTFKTTDNVKTRISATTDSTNSRTAITVDTTD